MWVMFAEIENDQVVLESYSKNILKVYYFPLCTILLKKHHLALESTVKKTITIKIFYALLVAMIEFVMRRQNLQLLLSVMCDSQIPC